MVPIVRSIFQNNGTKRYKWLSLESTDGTKRCLYESRTSVAAPSQKPSDCVEKCPATLNDYETAKGRILSEGYVMVTEQ
jgi:hypothetical protein